MPDGPRRGAAAPGAEGQACHAKLLELVDELARDNLRAGVMCQGDVPSATLCAQPQKFMQNSMMVQFFHRYLLNYGDVDGLIGGALVQDPLNFYQEGIPKLADGVSLDVGADWAALLDCNLTAGGTEVTGCSWVATGDGNMMWHNKPHTVALMLMAHELDPSIGLCSVSRAALDDPSITVGWDDHLGNDPGWWKGAAQMMQAMVFGVGIYDECSDP
ncbi:MAG: hypothetical protein GY856_31315 [bacterium]|nr:hypothetical protein [bacterium]